VLKLWEGPRTVESIADEEKVFIAALGLVRVFRGQKMKKERV